MASNKYLKYNLLLFISIVKHLGATTFLRSRGLGFYYLADLRQIHEPVPCPALDFHM